MDRRAGGIYVDMYVKKNQYDRAIDQARSKFFSFANMVKAGAGMALGAMGVNSALGAMRSIVMESSHLYEVMNKVNVIFGDSASIITQTADQMVRKFGVARSVTLEGAAAFGNLGKLMGNLSGRQLATFSSSFAKLAIDMTSFHDIPFEEAFTAIRSGLSGQVLALKRFGVHVGENRTKQVAWALGIAKVGHELNEQQKFLARSILIQRGLRDVMGDNERTLSSFKNQLRLLQGTVVDTFITLGTAIGPASGAVIKGLASAGQEARKFISQNFGQIGVVSQSVANALIESGRMIGRAMVAINDWFNENRDTIAAWHGVALVYVEAFKLSLATVAGVAMTMFGILDPAYIKSGTGITSFAATAKSALESYMQWLRNVSDGMKAIRHNWPLILEEVVVRVKQFGTDSVAVFGWLGMSVAKFLAWFGREWPNVFRDAFVGAMTAATNWGKNLADLIQEIKRFLKDPMHLTFDTSKLNINRDLLRDFKAKSAPLPDFGAPTFDHQAMDKQLEDIHQREGERDAEATAKEDKKKNKGSAFDAYERAKIAMGTLPKKPEAYGLFDKLTPNIISNLEGKKSESVDIKGFQSKVQSGVGAKEDTPLYRKTEQLYEVQRRALQIMEENQGKPAQAALGPA